MGSYLDRVLDEPLQHDAMYAILLSYVASPLLVRGLFYILV